MAAMRIDETRSRCRDMVMHPGSAADRAVDSPGL